MTILERIQILRGTATQNAAFTGLEGELVYLTDTKQVRIHDGVTAGGNAASSDILTRIEETSGDFSSVLAASEVMLCTAANSNEGAGSHTLGSFFVTTHPHDFPASTQLLFGGFDLLDINKNSFQTSTTLAPVDLMTTDRYKMVLVRRTLADTERVLAWSYGSYLAQASRLTYQDFIAAGGDGITTEDNYTYYGSSLNRAGKRSQIDSIYFDDDNIYIRHKALQEPTQADYYFRVQPVH